MGAPVGKDKCAVTTESGMLALLRKRFSSPEYTVISHVRSKAGFGSSRTADALAIGLWPSRGLHIHGIEIKVSRSDWLMELKNPAKADAVAKYCDFWWLAVGHDDIVRDGELPNNWGLMVPHRGGLRVVSSPKQLTPVAIDRSFLSALIRRVVETAGSSEEIEAARQSAEASANARIEQNLARYERQLKQERAENIELKRKLSQLVGAYEYTDGFQKIGEAFQSFRNMSSADLQYAAAVVSDAVARIRKLADLGDRAVREVVDYATHLTTNINGAGGDAKSLT